MKRTKTSEDFAGIENVTSVDVPPFLLVVGVILFQFRWQIICKLVRVHEAVEG